MRTTQVMKLLSVAAMVGALGVSGAAWSQSYGTDPSRPAAGTGTGTTADTPKMKGAATSPDSGALTARPMTPSKAETPDSAFDKLDANGHGFVTREDTRGLDNFDAAFQAGDRNGDGRLSPDEFQRAWSFYSGNAQ